MKTNKIIHVSTTDSTQNGYTLYLDGKETLVVNRENLMKIIPMMDGSGAHNLVSTSFHKAATTLLKKLKKSGLEFTFDEVDYWGASLKRALETK